MSMDAQDDGGQPNGEEEPSAELSEEETTAVAKRKAGSARVVHEVIRLQGDEELNRPALSLAFSGFAAGVAITSSVLATTFLKLHLPEAGWADLITGLGYSVGFVVVVLGNLQLFTETTVTAVLPLAAHPTLRNLGRLMRLWGVVLAANMAGTLLVAVMMAHATIVSPEQLATSIELSGKLLTHDPWTTMWIGIPAGFLVGSIAWILPNARGSEFWIVVMLTYIISIGGFSHVVAGSCEAWLLWLTGHASLGWVFGGFLVPALVGNILGGTGLFAVLAHGQVRSEL